MHTQRSTGLGRTGLVAALLAVACGNGTTVTPGTTGASDAGNTQPPRDAGSTQPGADAGSTQPGPDGGPGAWVPCTGAACPQVAQLTAGSGYACARLTDGSVRCWGQNDHGQLGLGNTDNQPRPVALPGLSGVVEVSASESHTCARRMDGTVQCWGEGTNGELGNGGMADASSPVTVTGLSGTLQVVTGAYHSCAVLGDHTVSCWGRGMDLGTGSVSSHNTPTPVPGLANVAMLAVAHSESFGESSSTTCALKADGTAVCWGIGGAGQIGNGMTSDSSTPTDVMGLTTGVGLYGGGQHLCAVLRDGTLACWGNNASRQLSNTTADQLTVPTAVNAVPGVRSVAAGDRFTCVLQTTGGVTCWGINGAGELGRGGVTADPIATPGGVVGLTGVTALGAGDDFACAFSGDGITRCWGQGTRGQLGDEGMASQGAPVPVHW